MVKFTIIISVVVLIASIILLFNGLFAPQPIQITLQSGQEITTSTAEYFSLVHAILLIVCAFLIGIASTYIFYNSDRTKTLHTQHHEQKHDYSAILHLLKPDEREAVKLLQENNGEMQQNQLAAKLGVSKVKATRILFGLEQKKLITKHRDGFTNKVKLEKHG